MFEIRIFLESNIEICFLNKIRKTRVYFKQRKYGIEIISHGNGFTLEMLSYILTKISRNFLSKMYFLCYI